MLLGVNIDHIATLREARKIADPSPLEAVFIVKNTRASQITLHLREDRRHIHELDLQHIAQNSPLPLNVECALNEEILEIIANIKPNRITLVPEKREEVTTEGGLDIKKHFSKITQTIQKFHDLGVLVSLFIDPIQSSIHLSKEANADMVELHTGYYANIFSMLFSNLSKTQHSLPSLELPRGILEQKLTQSLESLQKSAKDAHLLGLEVAAGHGLNYHNVSNIAQIPHIFELNIGQSIIARSVFVGLERAINEMLSVIENHRE